MALYDETTVAVASNNDIILLDADTGLKISTISHKSRLCRSGNFCCYNKELFVNVKDRITCYDTNGIMRWSSNVAPYHHGYFSPLPISLVINPKDKTIFIANPSSNSLYIFDTIGMIFTNFASSETFLEPLGIAFDHCNQLHVCCKTCVKVVDTQGLHITSYALTQRSRPVKIAVNSSGFKFVALKDNTIVVFGNEYQCLYSIKIQSRTLLDMIVTPNGILWISYVNHSVERKMELVRLPFSVAFQLPPTLSLFCQSTIVLHLADIPASLLPTKYLKHIDSWSKEIEVEVILPCAISHLSFIMRVKPAMSHLDIMEYLRESKRIPTLPGYRKHITCYETFSSFFNDKYVVKLIHAE